MKHKSYSKRIAHFKRKYKHLAAAFAGAMLMSSALLPGLPMATVHAAANPHAGNTRTATRTASTNRGDNTTGINMNDDDILGMSSHLGENDTNHFTSSEATSLPSEGGDKVTTVERSTNPNQDIVTKIQNENEDSTSASHSLPSEGGNRANQVGRSLNPNQDSVKIVLPFERDSQLRDQEQPSSDVPTEYKKVIDITATAYSPGPLDNDQWGNKTRMGTTIRPGVIAVDPKVIPLGSRVYVQYPDGHGEYKVAEDTGGAIKGNRIDVAIMNRGNAKDFGIKPVKVYVVDTPEET